MLRNWTSLTLLVSILALPGCATNKDQLLTHGSATMLGIWNQHAGRSSTSATSSPLLLETRLTLRRPLSRSEAQSVRAQNAAYTREAANEIYSQFQRLPNPDLVMYVFPHLAGPDPVPVPGYSTVFPMHGRVQYAMPGERTDDY